MPVSDQVLVEQLCNENPRFRKLYEEHLLLEKQLNEMDQKTYMTPEEELERKKVQKLKLAGKDEMEGILRSLRS
ncbi:DUF465 domain-containing protein [Geothermobacter hydrogeniphilus]|uniref:DUF465 domain-containing protein n=1 Tax=Geothermobacter hydrogeniphilus TaxID=1969733 RepID=A0A1X0Y2T2_9BACT|nr:YdcH family protein [Geothermobacter hydrogeniphilus]ORJ59521.1 DUF465 domain-containing protein [Geothermobacter hydrogeniphilus]PNU19787.1 DUF465 domain-containing protein [Geothermobacter hydrogeniphilus]